jgi:5-methylcytosine-specific restriction endonuclease McrA
LQCHAERARKRRENSPQVVRKYLRDWRRKNQESAKASNRKQYLANIDYLRTRAVVYVKQWRKANPEKRRASWNRRRAREIGAPGSHTAEQVLALLEMQDWKCAACDVSIKEKRHIDHIMPLVLGGSNWIWNLQGLCPTCNCSKNDKHPIEWARERGIFY